jgi:hypothetical protein
MKPEGMLGMAIPLLEFFMKILYATKITALVAAALFALAGCGSQHEALVSATVSPPAGTATHSSANDTVQFVAPGNFGTFGSFMNSAEHWNLHQLASSRLPCVIAEQYCEQCTSGDALGSLAPGWSACRQKYDTSRSVTKGFSSSSSMRYSSMKVGKS